MAACAVKDLRSRWTVFRGSLAEALQSSSPMMRESPVGYGDQQSKFEIQSAGDPVST
jgi:hypothetical protein